MKIALLGLLLIAILLIANCGRHPLSGYVDTNGKRYTEQELAELAKDCRGVDQDGSSVFVCTQD